MSIKNTLYTFRINRREKVYNPVQYFAWPAGLVLVSLPRFYKNHTVWYNLLSLDCILVSKESKEVPGPRNVVVFLCLRAVRTAADSLYHPNFHNLDHLHKDRPLPSLFRVGGDQLTGDREERLKGERGRTVRKRQGRTVYTQDRTAHRRQKENS